MTLQSVCLLLAVAMNPLPPTQPAAPQESASPPASTTRSSPHRITPLLHCDVGDWVVYESPSGVERVELTHRTLLLAELEVRTVLYGRLVGLPAIRTVRLDSDYAIDVARDDGGDLSESEDTIDAAGRRWRCRRTVSRWTRDGLRCERRIWMHPDVPIYGVVRSELLVNDRLTARMKLAAFGRRAPASQAER